MIKRLLKIGLFTFANRFYCTLEHFHIQSKTNGVNFTTLPVTEQFASAANFQIMGGEHKASTQILCVTDGFQTFFCICSHAFFWWCEQVSIGLMMAATHSSAQLV